MRKKDMLWQSDLGDGTYRNPILYTDYSDPDVIRVGDTFYMTASSFNYVPGLPILVSKDLVNWDIINYAVKKIPFDTYNVPAHTKGIWAPSIRYHDQRFYIFVGMPDEGIFVTHTTDPYKEWSPLTLVAKAKGWIDPCPIWDDDGRIYVVHGYAKSRIGFNSRLGLFCVNETLQICSEDQIIFDGTKTQPTIEGPKIYKREGYYYIFAPAGGVTNGWQTVLRAHHIEGPYEEKIVLETGNTDINGPHQGGWVTDVKGDDWFVHFQETQTHGRITHLQPLQWVSAWPIIGKEYKTGVGAPVTVHKKPFSENHCIYEIENSDAFNTKTLGLQWQWMANEMDDFYALEKDGLVLNNIYRNQNNDVDLWHAPNILTQKIATPAFEVETQISTVHMKPNDKSGVIVIGSTYSYLGMIKKAQGCRLVYVESGDTSGIVSEKILFSEDTPSDTYRVKLRYSPAAQCQFYIAEKGKEYRKFGDAFQITRSMWVGTKIGLFAVADANGDGGKTKVEYFRVVPWNS